MMMAVLFVPIDSAFAKEPQFRLDIDSLNLQQGVSAELVLSIIDGKGADIEAIEGIDNFDVLATMQSTSTQIINGDTTRETTVTYTIMPKNTGDFTLKGKVNYKGKTYETNELQINVNETSQTNELDQEAVEEIFIKTQLSKDELFFGEKAVLSYTLYSRYNIENYGFTEAVNIDGLMLEDIPEDQLKSEIVYVNGEKYAKYDVKQIILSTLKTGTYTIPAYNFQANISTSSGFFSTSKPVYLQTEEKQITVNPLPLDNQPSNFSGIVGDLNIEANYSGQELDVEDSLTLKVVVSGNCNLDRLDQIMDQDIDGFSVYETQKDLKESIQENQYRAQKEFEIILVPEKTGEIKIDPITLSYFDPESESYQKVEISGTTIKVTGEMPQEQQMIENKTAEATESVTIRQVNYQSQAIQNEEYVTIQLRKDYLYIGLSVAAILAIIIAALVTIRKQQQKDQPLHELYKQLNKANNKNEVYNLFNKMIKYRFDVSIKASSKRDIQRQLETHALADQVLRIMDCLEKENVNNIAEIKEKINDVYKRLNKN